MSVYIVPMTEAEAGRAADAGIAQTDEQAGLGALRTDRGNLPLDSIGVRVTITGLVSRTELTQSFVNPHGIPLEATYIFPLPDRAAVTAMRMTADGRVVQARLKERGAARQEYDQAIAGGRRASIAEEERPDVFTLRVGNILPGERVGIELTLDGALPYSDGEATYRLPLVVAPRYVPGAPLPGDSVGAGHAEDTDAVPDASRISPPVLLPGYPNPVRLAIDVDIDPAGLPLREARSSLHPVAAEGGRVSIRPGERVDRDFILRLSYGEPDAASHALTLTPDGPGDEGTFRLMILPPTSAVPPRPRDVVLLLDRSGSMQGWKMVAARRAAARIVDTLTSADRFAVLTFDHTVDRPASLPAGLVVASDRHRYRAVEHLARVDARGGTELLGPLTRAIQLLSRSDEERDRVLVLVTDGQVGNEDEILSETTTALRRIRVHTVGIDRAVNAGFLGRLAGVGGGRCELVESEDRLDAAMDRIHRRIAAPLVTGLTLTADGLTLLPDTLAPARLPDLFPGAPLIVTGRLRQAGAAAMTVTGRLRQAGAAAMTVTGRDRQGRPWSARVEGTVLDDPALAAVWARAHLRDLEDRYVALDRWDGGDPADALEQRIVQTSLRFGVLCRFTAWLAVDTRVAADGTQLHRVVQPVEPVAGWDLPMIHPSLAAAPSAERSSAIASPGLAPHPVPAADVARMFPPPGWRGRRAARASGAKPPARVSPELDELAGSRALLTEEVGRLRAAQDAPEWQRRELLADLGSRLAALAHHLVDRGLDGGLLAPLSALVAELESDRPLGVPAAAFEELWLRALRMLGELTVELTRSSRRRPDFWKGAR